MKGKVAEVEPVAIKLEAGKTYAWCACGESENQPFCDGKHVGSAFSPEIIKVDQAKTVYMCQCKQTNTPGFCDGSHASL